MKKNDLILIGGLLIIAFTILVGQRLWQKNNTTSGAEVVVVIDGKEYERLPLNQDASKEIQLSDGQLNILQIKDGEAFISEANCPDKICEKHHPISYNGQSIVCLPHKLVVSIDGGKEMEVDTIAQ